MTPTPLPEQKVEIPEYPNIPRWLVLQGEIDLRMFLMEQMLKRPRSAIVQMIDEATGFDKQLLKEAQELVAETRWLKAEYEKEQL